MNSTISSSSEFRDQVFEKINAPQNQIYASEFIDCIFKDCDISESVFQRCRFANCSFLDCDLSLIQVPECSFSTNVFEGSKIIGVNWAQAEWPQPRLGKPIRFSNSTLNHSTFIGLNLEGVQIKDCSAMNVDFREADLSTADFSGSDLADSMFLNTRLGKANLSQARNYRIDPSQNHLKGAKFSLPEAMSLLYSMDIILTGGEADA